MSKTKTDRLCRTCMNDSNSHSPIYREPCLEDSILFEVINDVCHLEVTEGDGLPEYICHDCFAKLSDFQKFKYRAHEVNVALQRMKEHELKSESESVLWESSKTEDESNFEQENDGSGLGSKEHCGSTLVLHHDWIKPDYSASEHEQDDVNAAGMDQVEADVKSEFSNGNASYCGGSNLMQPNEESVADPDDDDDHLSYPVKVEPEDSFDEAFNGREHAPYEEYIGIEPDDLACNTVGFDGTTPANTDPLQVPVNVTELKQESFSPERCHPTKLAYNGVGFDGTTPATTDPLQIPVNVTELKQESFSPERCHPTKLAYNGVGFDGTTPATTDPLQIPVNVTELKQESFSPERCHPTKLAYNGVGFDGTTPATTDPLQVPVNVTELKQESFSPERCHPTKLAYNGVGFDGTTPATTDPLQVNRSSTHGTLEDEGEEEGGANKEVRRQKVDIVTSRVKQIEGNGKLIDKSEEGNSPDDGGRCRKITANKKLEWKRSRKSKICNETHEVVIEKAERKNSSGRVVEQESSKSDTQLGLENLTGDEQVENLSRTYSCLEDTKAGSSSIDSGWYFCDLCRKGFFDKCSLGNHLRGHMGLDPVRCVIGGGSTSKGVDRLRAEAMGGGNVCSVCGEAFKEEYCLEAHMRRYHLDQGKRSKSLCKQRRFSCDTCGKGFYKKWDLIYHIRVHTGERPFRCDICSKAFFSKNKLNEHVLSHGSERPNQCHLCGKRFAYRRGLTRHIMTHLEMKYGCTFCEKRFIEKFDLNRHLITHSDEKPFLCNVCGKTFKVAYSLKVHLGMVHGGPKRHRCEICGKGFFRKSVLDDHIKIHGDERPYACKVCDKTFKTRNSAKRHQSTHSGLKPHSCSFCTKQFRTTGHLKEHHRTHTLEKPFECAHCGIRFSHSSALKRHKKSRCKKETAT